MIDDDRTAIDRDDRGARIRPEPMRQMATPPPTSSAARRSGMHRGALIVLSVSLCVSSFVAGQEARQASVAFAFAGPSFIAVRVADADAAATWYRDVLGVDEVNRIDDDDGRYAIRILSGGGLSVELIEERGVEPPAEPHLGLFKAGIYVVDLDALHAHLMERGVDVDAGSFTDEALMAHRLRVPRPGGEPHPGIRAMRRRLRLTRSLGGSN